MELLKKLIAILRLEPTRNDVVLSKAKAAIDTAQVRDIVRQNGSGLLSYLDQFCGTYLRKFWNDTPKPLESLKFTKTNTLDHLFGRAPVQSMSHSAGCIQIYFTTAILSQLLAIKQIDDNNYEKAKKSLHDVLTQYIYVSDYEKALSTSDFVSVTIFSILALHSANAEKKEAVKNCYCMWLRQNHLESIFWLSDFEHTKKAYCQMLWDKHHIWSPRNTNFGHTIIAAQKYTLQTFYRPDCPLSKAPLYPTLNIESNKIQLIQDATGLGKTSFLRACVLSLVCNLHPGITNTTRESISVEDQKNRFIDLSNVLFRENELDKIPVLIPGAIFGRQAEFCPEKNVRVNPDLDLLFRAALAYAEPTDEGIRNGLALFDESISPVMLAFLRRKAETGKMILFIDAFDEAADRDVLAEYIRAFRMQYQNVNVLITCRPIDLTVLTRRTVNFDRWKMAFGDLATNTISAQQKELIGKYCLSNDAMWRSEDELSPDEKSLFDRILEELDNNNYVHKLIINPYLLTIYLVVVTNQQPRKIGEMLQPIEQDIIDKMFTVDGELGNTAIPSAKITTKFIFDNFCKIAYGSLKSTKNDYNVVSEEQVSNAMFSALSEIDRLNRFTTQFNNVLEMSFTTQPGILVANEQSDFMFLSDLFLCDMAAYYLITKALPAQNDKPKKRTLLIDFLEKVGCNSKYPIDAFILICNAILGHAQRELKNVDPETQLTKAEVFSIVIEKYTNKLSNSFSITDFDSIQTANKLLDGAIDLLVGRYQATDISSSNARDNTILDCQSKLVFYTAMWRQAQLKETPFFNLMKNVIIGISGILPSATTDLSSDQ